MCHFYAAHVLNVNHHAEFYQSALFLYVMRGNDFFKHSYVCIMSLYRPTGLSAASHLSMSLLAPHD